MKNEMEVKSQVLEMLKDFLLKEEGSKLKKPVALSVEMTSVSKPKSLESLVEDDEDDMDTEDMDEEDCGKRPKMSLKDFLANK